MTPDIQGLDTLQNSLLRERILAQEIRLAEEVALALNEKDIMLLRTQLKQTAEQTAQSFVNEHLTDASAFFGLSEEIVKPVNLDFDNQDEEIGNYLHQLHIKNHTLAQKEVVYDLFSENEEVLEVDNLMMSPEDELLFEELRAAVSEKDINELRANIQSIARSVSMHRHTFEEIEELVSDELDAEVAAMMREEAKSNVSLSDEIFLHEEINHAIAEVDVMNLRAGLRSMMGNEYSHSRTIDEIDSYLRSEMDESALSSFEAEMLTNSGLAAEVVFHKEVQLAVGEMEVITLRGGLGDISRDGANENIRILGITSPKRRLLFWSAAASIAVLFALSALMQPTGYSDQDLYGSYYQPYRNGTNISRSASTSSNVLSAAILEIDKGDYQTALEMLKIVSANKQDSFSASFYSGEAYRALGDYKSAIASYTEVIRQGDNLLVEQSEWYKGLCYLKMNEREKAVNQFKAIVSRKGYYSEKSSSLLKKLD